MSGLEDRLSLDISEALSAVSQLESAFVAAGKSLQDALDQAVASFQIPDSTVDLTANVEDVTPAIDSAIAAADTSLPIETDGAPITSAIDDAIAQADTNLEVTADVSEAQDAISSLSGETIPIEVDTTGVEEATAQLQDLSTAGHEAGAGGEAAGEGIGQARAAAALAGGEFAAGTELLKGFGAAGAAAAAGIGIAAIAGKELFTGALQARSATERFNLSLGAEAEAVEKIDIGGLNEDLSTLTVRLGSTDVAAKNAAANIFEIGKSAGKADPEIAATTEQVLALAARAVALKPALGDVGDVAQRLFTGLARGGRFASNFNISLTQADITARALSDSGKTLASDLTIYEKAAAGAELATERLGTGLSTDIATGSKNIATQFKAVRAEFNTFIEDAGQPLLDPLLESIQKALPSLKGLATIFAEVLAGAVQLIPPIADGLEPAFAALDPLAVALGGALKIVADVLDLIPAPLRGAVIGFLALNAALKAIAATKAIGSLSSLPDLLRSLNSGAGLAAIGIIGIGSAIAFVNSQVDKGSKAVQDFADGFIATANQAGSFADLDAEIADLTNRTNALGEAANKLNTPGGRLFHSGELREDTNARLAAQSVLEGVIDLRAKAADLQKQFGLTETAALNLARGGDEAIQSFIDQKNALDPYLVSLAQAARATDQFWLAAQSGSLTAAEIADKAAELKVGFEDLSKAVDEARKPVVDFAQSVIDTLPGASQAIADLDKDSKVHLQSFLDTFTQKTLEAAQFVGNIQELVRRGAGDLATEIEKQGAEAGAGIAAEAVRLTDANLKKAEDNIDRIHTIQANNAANLLQVASDLNGGIQLRQEQAGEEFGKKLELIPGQVEPSSKKAGNEIGDDLSNAILVGSTLGTLPEDMTALGTQSAVGLAQGLEEGGPKITTNATQLAENVLGTVRKIFQISSPSKVMQDIGELVAEGFSAGLADIAGAADLVDPIIKKLDEFKLSAADLAKATGSSSDEIVSSLDAIGKAQKTITPDDLLKVGEAVKALGGSKGVKDLQTGIAEQVAAAFKGLDTKGIGDVVSKINTQAALQRVQGFSGVTPNVPDPFATNVVKGPDAAAPNIELTVNVTPPPEATPEEIAFLTARATGWLLQGVQ